MGIIESFANALPFWPRWRAMLSMGVSPLPVSKVYVTNPYCLSSTLFANLNIGVRPSWWCKRCDRRLEYLISLGLGFYNHISQSIPKVQGAILFVNHWERRLSTSAAIDDLESCGSKAISLALRDRPGLAEVYMPA
jgi:hypothetical protein